MIRETPLRVLFNDLLVKRTKLLTFGENVNRRSVRQQPRPAFELPRRSLNKDGHNSIPVGNVHRVVNGQKVRVKYLTCETCDADSPAVRPAGLYKAENKY